MKIEFYFKKTGEACPPELSDNRFFVMNNKVYADNLASYESQEAAVDFDTFIVERDDIEWRAVILKNYSWIK